ncbi:MAG: HAD hydrolase-like protein [Halomonas sp.]|nr:HAD family hydrolase [Halomonas sp.]MCC5903067.1 HAD hydrolase-like protein [Halomonas sp.]
MTQYKLNTPIKSFNTYVFDCDGVLLDSNRVKTEAFYHAALPYGEPAAQAFTEYHKANGGISRQKKFEYFFLNILNLSALPEDKYQKALNDYGKLTAEGLVRCEVLPGVLEFLTSLPAQAKKFVVSGGAQDEVRWVLEAKGLAKFFDGIYGNPVDKLTLVKNLGLKDSDYPGIFFGDARYDHEVAKANGLDFIFLSAVSDFNSWEEYVESYNLQTFESFTSLSLAAQIAEQKALLEKEQAGSELISEAVDRDNAYFFGFPFSPLKKSRFAGGLTIGPGVLKHIASHFSVFPTIFSRSAMYYFKEGLGRQVDQEICFKDSSPKYLSECSSYNLEKLTSNVSLSSIMEMEERHRYSQLESISIPFFQISDNIRKKTLNKITYWDNQIEKDSILFYVNSNVPHLGDDLICYELCRFKKIPTAFPYRMPIVPGVMARLYIPESLYNHSEVYNREGELISYSRYNEYDSPLASDLQLIFDRVVMGDETLGGLSRSVLSQKGIKPPVQYVPAKAAVDNFSSLFKFFHQKKFSRARLGWIAKKAELSNKKKLSSLAVKDVPEVPFIYYALHMQPEASSNPLGGMFSDQVRAISFLSSKLPKDWVLVVKEHPYQKLEVRAMDFYEQISNIPNVVLISMDAPSDKLQLNAKAIATLTGTAALESWLKLKPALVLGNIIYQDAPGIYKIRTEEDLIEAYGKISGGYVHTENDIYHYLQFIGESTFFGHLDAYIDPCIPAYELDLEENECEIGYRISKALESQLKYANREGV